jgi:hypothetical protein
VHQRAILALGEEGAVIVALDHVLHRAGHERRQVRGGLIGSDARFQTRDGGPREVADRRLLRIEASGQEELRCVRGLEHRGRDADDFRRFAVQPDGATNE